MQIACERCSTTYVLDDSLIPPQGAPVQCTRCGLVFTAKPPTAAAAPAKKPAPLDLNKSSGTMVFGAVGGPPGSNPPPSAPKAGGTMVFGAVAGPSAPTPAPIPKPAPQANSTMMFGAVAPGTPTPAAEPKLNATLPFGSAPPPAAAGAHSTMVFGAVTGPTAPAAAKPAGTMIFGAVTGPAEPPVKPGSTVSFGAPNPQPAQPKPNATMVFGAVSGSDPRGVGSTPRPMPAVDPAAKPNSTMMFGAVSASDPRGMAPGAPTPAPVQAPTQPAGSSTMMFGAVSPSAPPASTPAPSAPAGRPNATAMFGAISPGGAPTPAPVPAAQPKPNATMVFGSVAPSAAPAPTPAPIATGPAPRGNATAMFGAISPGTPTPAPLATPAPRGNATAMFGAISASDPRGVSASQPPASAPAQASVNSTLLFGTASPVADLPEPPPSAPQPAPAAPSSQTKPSTTLMFGAPPPGLGDLAPEPAAQPRPAAQGNWQAPPPVEPDYHPQDSVQAEPHEPAPRAPAAPRPLIPGADANPENPFGPPQRGQTQEMEAFSKELAGRGKRTGLIAGAVVGLLALAAVGSWYAKQPKPPPAELVTQVETTYSTMEKDDTASLKAALHDFESLQATAPAGYVGPAAGQLLTLSLLIADQREQLEELQAQFAAGTKELKKLEDKHETADWKVRADLKRTELEQLKAAQDPLVASLEALSAQEQKLFDVVKQARSANSEDPDANRALGVYYAFKANPNGPTIAKSYRKGRPSDGWGALIEAAYGAHDRQSPENLKKSLDAAREAQKQDARLNRAKRLEVRLAVQLGDFAGARAKAQELVLANASDAGAKKLVALVDAAEAAAKAKAAPAPAPAP